MKIGATHSVGTRKKMRTAKLKAGTIPPSRKGTKTTEETKIKLRAASLRAGCTPPNHKGRIRSIETRLRMSKARSGSRSNFWKGGKTKASKIIRESIEYRLWREAVFKRDDYTCIWCGVRGDVLNADHIKPFAYFPELRFAIDNGRTLCRPCHKTTDTWGYKAKKFVV